MLLLQALDTPSLPAFRYAVRFVVQLELRRALDSPQPDPEELHGLSDSAKMWNLSPANDALNFAAQSAVMRMLAQLGDTPEHPAQLGRCIRLLDVMDSLGLNPDLWHAQNMYYDLAHTAYPNLADPARKLFTQLGERLRVAIGK
jgi:hypothetical protein